MEFMMVLPLLYGNEVVQQQLSGILVPNTEVRIILVYSRKFTTLSKKFMNTHCNYNICPGGYAYRLCKLGKDGYAGLTEECFQEGHLNFDGDYNWLQVLSGDEVVTTIRQTAIRNTKGTTPEGSEWTTWHYTTINDAYPGDQIWGWKDMVQIPESLEPGSYVLSFRWDCQLTPQIWQTCANVEIV